MAFQRGDVVLIPFPFTDLSAAKTRPAIVVSSNTYHAVRSELLLAYVSSQLSKVNPLIDYPLTDWKVAGLPKPSFVRPKIAAIEPTLVVHQIGKLTMADLSEIDRRLRQALALTESAVGDVVAEVKLTSQPPKLVQALAEKSILALITLAAIKTPDVDIERLKKLLAP